MFGWIRPACPCDPLAKTWVEGRLQWLVEQFDDTCFSGRPIIRPTPGFFPDPYDGSEPAVRTLLDRVCGYMGVPPERVDLTLVADAGKIWLVNEVGQYLPGAAGTYEEGDRQFIIRIDRTELDDPMGLVGTLAHELAHARLLGEGRITPEVYDNELLTDLTVVALGLGVFLANTPRNWDSQLGKWPGSDLNRPEYMSPPMFGYALAHLAWFRGEPQPDLAADLRWAVRGDYKQAVRFLRRTGDSAFRPRTAGRGEAAAAPVAVPGPRHPGHETGDTPAGGCPGEPAGGERVDEFVAADEGLDPWGTGLVLAAGRCGLAMDGLRLISDALDHAPRLLGVAAGEHIRGAELCAAVAGYAEEVLEAEAFDALAEWGLATGQDVGRGVAILVEAGMMEASADDSPDDFAGLGPLRTFVGLAAESNNAPDTGGENG